MIIRFIKYIALFSILLNSHAKIVENNRFTLTGIVIAGDLTKLSVYDSIAKESKWFFEGSAQNQFKVVSFNKTTNQAIIEVGGDLYTLNIYGAFINSELFNNSKSDIESLNPLVETPNRIQEEIQGENQPSVLSFDSNDRIAATETNAESVNRGLKYNDNFTIINDASALTNFGKVSGNEQMKDSSLTFIKFPKDRKVDEFSKSRKIKRKITVNNPYPQNKIGAHSSSLN